MTKKALNTRETTVTAVDNDKLKEVTCKAIKRSIATKIEKATSEEVVSDIAKGNDSLEEEQSRLKSEVETIARNLGSLRDTHQSEFLILKNKTNEILDNIRGLPDKSERQFRQIESKITEKLSEKYSDIDSVKQKLSSIERNITNVERNIKNDSKAPLVSDIFNLTVLGLILVSLGTFTHNNIILTLGAGFLVLYAMCIMINKLWSK